ncbi:hypothetical protein AAVH_19513 [Aphelenchoides avenae]|nr:hypothetical protein AAVH_19513 [Aphelenchus avenae]
MVYPKTAVGGRSDNVKSNRRAIGESTQVPQQGRAADLPEQSASPYIEAERTFQRREANNAPQAQKAFDTYDERVASNEQDVVNTLYGPSKGL